MRIYQGSRLIWSDIQAASNFWRRMVGLLATRHLDPQSGLLIWPCKQVHGFHMKYAIDVIFLSRLGEVLGIDTLEPGHISKNYSGAHYALEVNAGQARLFCIKPGDFLVIEN